MQSSSLFIMAASPFVGSFIGCVADRLPVGRPLAWSRSVCDHCDHPLGPRDLVPLISWLLGGARCRYCRGKISPYYPLVELAALAVAASALAVLDGALLWVTIGFGWTLLALAAMDVRHMILADSLNLILALSGLGVAAIWSRLPLVDHVLGMLIGAGALYLINLIYRTVRNRDGLGMGDVKLMAGAGAWLGWQALPSVLLCATMAALVVVSVGFWGSKPTRNTAVPFGAFICLGSWTTWLAGPIDWNVW